MPSPKDVKGVPIDKCLVFTNILVLVRTRHFDGLESPKEPLPAQGRDSSCYEKSTVTLQIQEWVSKLQEEARQSIFPALYPSVIFPPSQGKSELTC
jgi:hypothetical protein